MKKKEYKVLGVMSGTSLDGIDVALLKFSKNQGWNYQIREAETFPYPADWKKTLAEAVFFDDLQLQELNIAYTAFLGKLIKGFLKTKKIEGLDAVCSHGHTIKHEPENGFTLQIGNLPQLAQLVGKKVVCDFRVQDVALGGQGAPLVPIGDRLLFPEYEFCLNLGGFANVSTETNGQRIAYDICPVNTVLNFLAGKLDMPYDKGGQVAASGTLDEKLLGQLNALDFYAKLPPKSLGIEWVNQHILPLFSGYEDIPAALHTYTVHAAHQIAQAVDTPKKARVLVTGGGAFNEFLISQISRRTGNDIVLPPEEVINYKEALIFGLLGVLKLRGEVNVLSSVTGASRDHSSGTVYLP